MNKCWSLAAVLGAVALAGTLSRLQGQATSQNVEQQLQSEYRLTRAGATGRVAGEPGAVLVVQQSGLTAIPASYEVYWYSTFKNGGPIKSSSIQHGGSVGIAERRRLQAGEKAYLLNIEIKPAEVAFYVQTCGVCDGSTVDPNDPPFRARLAFQFDKGYAVTSNLKQTEDTIGQVFKIEKAGPPPKGPEPPFPLPSSYVSAQSSGDQIQFNADKTLSLQEGGQSYRGTFVITGNTVEINITETNTKSTMTVQGSTLTDSNGQTWALRNSASTQSGGNTLRNDDILKLAKVGMDDAAIIAKIESSQCKFDTSPDALIQLKQNGVSAAVLKAMVGTGK